MGRMELFAKPEFIPQAGISPLIPKIPKEFLTVRHRRSDFRPYNVSAYLNSRGMNSTGDICRARASGASESCAPALDTYSGDDRLAVWADCISIGWNSCADHSTT
ncbi:Hypothetical protein NTJ_03048 [Nesidiocoris tenuis]|uniref:Uncharacterized protein n=1 Tax=Nesidiocoris tenuis TaxID=355587 RepID=A0ABN7AH94_9HEMI|nr:Hypothetical protein NTJ_03048 [Nesidiocoris tenuis]